MNIPTSGTIAGSHTPFVAALLIALGLSGCATFSKDGGLDSVAAEAKEHLNKDIRWTRTATERSKNERQVADLLRQPLSAEDAVQIALLNNRSLQASFEELGISEADLVQSGRLPNPRFMLRHASAAGQFDIEETLSFNVLALLTTHFTHEIEKRRFKQAQGRAVIAVMQLANDTRRAYFAAVAARESVRYLTQVQSAAEAGSVLAQRMVAAGNWTLIDQARERTFYTDAAQRSTHAGLVEVATREKLLRLLGMTDDPAVMQLAERLPELPPSIENLPDIEQAVLQNRIDLRQQRLRLDELAHSLNLGRASRFINVLDVGATRIRQGSESQPYEHGYEVILEIPIFDGGGPRVRRAQGEYSQAADRFAQAAIDARSQIRLAYAAYRAAFDIAQQQRDEVIPTQKAVAAENLLRYNASLISIFDLLADARTQISGVDDYIQSVRDFWMAKSELDAALIGDPSR